MRLFSRRRNHIWWTAPHLIKSSFALIKIHGKNLLEDHRKIDKQGSLLPHEWKKAQCYSSFNTKSFALYQKRHIESHPKNCLCSIFFRGNRYFNCLKQPFGVKNLPTPHRKGLHLLNRRILPNEQILRPGFRFRLL